MKAPFVSLEQARHRFIYMMKREFEKQPEIFIRLFRGTPVLKNIMQ